MLAEALADYIKERGFKQRMIAERAGLTESELSRILRQKSQLKADVFLRICDALEVSMGHFHQRGE